MMDKSSDGVAIGHLLWLHNLCKAYGMWDFASARFKNLEETRKSWKSSSTFEKNIEKWSFNPGSSLVREFVQLFLQLRLSTTPTRQPHAQPCASVFARPCLHTLKISVR